MVPYGVDDMLFIDPLGKKVTRKESCAFRYGVFGVLFRRIRISEEVL